MWQYGSNARKEALSHLGQYSVELMGGNNTGTICGANDPK